MKKRIPRLALVIFAAGFLVFCGSSHSVPAKSPDASIDRSIHDLKARVTKLEAKIADLQKQLKSLEGKYPRVLAIPDSGHFPADRIPPGAKQHEVGGIKYWTIPLSPGQ
jgi:cell division protein FtsL